MFRSLQNYVYLRKKSFYDFKITRKLSFYGNYEEPIHKKCMASDSSQTHSVNFSLLSTSHQLTPLSMRFEYFTIGFRSCSVFNL